MASTQFWATRCVTQPGALPQQHGGIHALLCPSSRRQNTLGFVAPSPHSPFVCNGVSKGGRTTASQAWQGPREREDFESLQARAVSRLHRFYVPLPLGPQPPAHPLLDALLAGTPALEAVAPQAAASQQPAPPAAAAPRAAPRRRSDLSDVASGTPHCDAPSPSSSSSSSSSALSSLQSSPGASDTSSSPASASPAIGRGGGGAAAVAPATVVLEGDEARHASRALRLQPGDRVELCDGRGNVAEGTLTGADRQRVWVATDGPSTHVPWSGSRWVVAVACTTLKGDRADWLVEKLTEVGAFMLVPLVSERSQAGGKAKFRIRGAASASASSRGSETDGELDGDYQPGRLERVAIAATKQSLRPHALRLAPPTPLSDVLPLVQRVAGGGLGRVAGEGRESSEQGEGRDGQRKKAAAEDGAADGGRVEGSRKRGIFREGRWCGGGRGQQCRNHRAWGRWAWGWGWARGRRKRHRAGGRCGRGLRGGAGGGACGGDGGFALVAVAGAPSLASVLSDLQLSHAAGRGSVTSNDGVSAKGAAGGRESPLRLLVIGPEGDFTPAELAALVGAGARPVGLGKNRLRTETAAVALLAACMFGEDEM